MGRVGLILADVGNVADQVLSLLKQFDLIPFPQCDLCISWYFFSCEAFVISAIGFSEVLEGDGKGGEKSVSDTFY